MPQEITIEIKDLTLLAVLLFLGAIFIMELLLTLNSPIVFGDEGFHTMMAQYIAQEVEYPVWNPLGGTKLTVYGFYRLPLWNFLEAGFISILGFNELIIKFLTPFIAFLTGIVVFLLVKRIYNKNIAFIAAAIAVTVPSFVTYAVLFYTDTLFTFYFSLFILMFIIALNTGSKKYWIVSGAFGALAFLTKMPGITSYFFIVLAFIYQVVAERKFRSLLKKYFIIMAIMVLIPSTFFLRSMYYYKTPECELPLPFFKGTCEIDNFKQKYQFSGITQQTGTEVSIFSLGLMNYLSFAYGNIWFVVLAFLCGLIIISAKRRRDDLMVLLFTILILIIFYRASNRSEDTARYTLGWVPVIALVGAIWFDEIYNYIKTYYKQLALVVFVIVIVLGYLNFRDKLSTMVNVKQFSPSFLEACNWVKENTPKDSLLMTVWVNQASYNCQRNVTGNMADMEISTDLNYTLDVAKENGITHIFIQKFSLSNQYLAESYNLKFVQLLVSNPNCFKNVFENGPTLQDCINQGGCDGNIVYEINTGCMG